MINKTVMLKGLQDTDARMVTYLPDNYEEIDLDRERISVLLCPGGGYQFCSEREAEPVALQLLAAGYNVFVLYYHVAPYRFPAPQQDVALAIAHVREHAKEYHAVKDQIVVMGFSAGGHLAASIGVMWNQPELWAPLGLTCEMVKPNAMVLGYPVITAGEFTHRGSFEMLTGSKAIEDHQAYSLEKLVGEHTPPTFLWHTMNDGTVPVENTLLFAQAMSRCHLPAEIHIFPDGCHGLSLANKECAAPTATQMCNPHCQPWIGLAAKWIQWTLDR
ncbi:MAG: alpha/beta hydrolase [Eubacteriales bacterium]|nr:alpha/beta hydrolase [Eubacteriales bacterium]